MTIKGTFLAAVVMVAVGLVTVLLAAACGGKAAPTPTIAPTATGTSSPGEDVLGAEGSRFVPFDIPEPLPPTEEGKARRIQEVTAVQDLGRLDAGKPPPETTSEGQGAERAGFALTWRKYYGGAGRLSIINVVNRDIVAPSRSDPAGEAKVWNVCGQAAVATVLSNYESVRGIGGIVGGPHGADAYTNINLVYDRFPPDVIGTSPWRMVAALNGFGVSVFQGNREEELKKWVGQGYLPIVLLDITPAAVDEGWVQPGQDPNKYWGQPHWVVVYAWDAHFVYVSNWPADQEGWRWSDQYERDVFYTVSAISWTNFRKAWNTWLTHSIWRATRTDPVDHFMMTWR